ncbi:MAG: chemotaxis protein CheC [Myxococcota bacterium]
MTLSEDRLRELASVGSGHAANALGQLLDCTVLMEPPRCYRLEVGHLSEALIYEEEWSTAIFVDLSGAVTGRAGLMLTRNVVDGLLDRLVKEHPAEEVSERGRSALEELGNIALSAAAGAMGDLSGGIVLPSVPRLGLNLSRETLLEELGSVDDRRPAYLADTQLVQPDGPLRIRFLWIPDQ